MADGSTAAAGPSGTSGDQEDQKFCLKWNDFQENILGTLQTIRAAEDFFDVTLVCHGENADGRVVTSEVRAHKLILSACSEFFHQMLRRISAPNPVIVLWDVTRWQMQKILRFMYNGEVDVDQANLNEFLSVAERLRVRGLSQSYNNGSGSSPEKQKIVKRRRSSNNLTSNSGGVGGGEGKVQLKRFRDSEDRLGNDDEIAEDERDGGGGNDDDYSSDTGGAERLGEASSLMGHAGSMDPAAAKEFLRRATLATMQQLGLPPSLAAVAGAAAASGSSAAVGRGDAGGGGGSASSGANSAYNPRSASADGSPMDYHQDYEYGMMGGERTASGRRARSVFTSEQIYQLELAFKENEYIDGMKKRELSMLTKIPETQIKIWFQNRRQKKKRESEEAASGASMHQQMMVGHPMSPGGMRGLRTNYQENLGKIKHEGNLVGNVEEEDDE